MGSPESDTLQGKEVVVHTMNTYGSLKAWLELFLTSALNGGKRLVSRLSHFTPRERVTE